MRDDDIVEVLPRGITGPVRMTDSKYNRNGDIAAGDFPVARKPAVPLPPQKPDEPHFQRNHETWPMLSLDSAATIARLIRGSE
jgi:hypothetical protein